MKRLLALLAVIAALWLALLVGNGRSGPYVVSGFLEADEVRVGSRVGGRVARVLVEEGAAVGAGDLLVELEPFDLAERRAEAEAELAARRAEHARLSAGFRPEEVAQGAARRDQIDAELRRLVDGPRRQEIEAGRARAALAEAELELARLDHERARTLRAENVASEEAVDRAKSRLSVAEAELEVRRQELALLEEGTRAEEVERARAELAEADAALALLRAGYRAEEVAQAAAAVAAAEANLRALDTRLRELRIVAPCAGRVETIDLRPGDLVATDAPVLSLLDPARLWVRAYVPEDRLTLRLGDAVDVGVDAFPDERFRGRVGFIARGAEFTPRNVQTPEERAKQVFRVKVYLEEGLDRLRPGTPADVWIDTARPGGERP